MTVLVAGIDPAALAEGARRLTAGELVAFPTETVYGLGARADDDAAVAKIFAAKGRPSDHPLIVHVLDEADAALFASTLPPVAQKLMHAFWPGPLTVIVPRAPGRGAAAAGGQDSIGLRCPAHPVARALLQAARVQGVLGVAAPSANRFGRVSPTSAAHVVGEFEPGLLVLDGGDCEVGIESSIVDCSRGRPVLLRPGVITRAQIEAAIGEPLGQLDAAAPRASGTLEAHYAPAATVRLLTLPVLRDALAKTPQQGLEGVAVYSRTLSPRAGSLDRHMPDDAIAAAHELFAVLRALDDAGARQIWIEAPEQDPAWDGVRDRLTRAAAATPGA
ncbi:translation factor SUA5 [Roseateles toxinivorans]|uniref:Threonylcarbamoyl-AMP synthase n=1 Tax=Roseateles toxinivorans TaxID=270368 RepID=A0A4R6QGK6_9BURK|nr:translation factor SUA5 [Roseateles toxinivorans]